MAIDMTRNRRPPGGSFNVLVRYNEAAAEDHEIDVSAFALDDRGKVLSDKHFVYFNNTSSPDGAVRFHRGNVTVRAGEVDSEVAQVAVAITVYGAAVGFGRIPGARVTVYDVQDTLIADYDLTTGMPEATSVIYGRFIRDAGTWRFWADGTTYPDLVATVASFGVTTA